MSHPDPQQPSLADAARGDVPSAPSIERPLPDFPQHPTSHTPIEREIERSERASAALAAARALARASFTDSQLAADDAENGIDDGDIDTSGWIRTEYASLDQSVRTPQAGIPHGGAPRNLVGGSFNPGIASQQARAYAASPIGQMPIKTRTGAQARFHHESRQTPRPERAAANRIDLSLSAGTAHYDKPAVVPMLAAPSAAPAGRPPLTAIPARPRATPSEPLKFAVAAGLGVVVTVMGGAVAWKAGWLSHVTPTNPALVTEQVAAQAEAARVRSAPQAEPPVAPAPGVMTPRTNAEVDAALAAAARAAAVPVASVHAAGPSRALAPPSPEPVAVVAMPKVVPTTPVAAGVAPVGAQRPAIRGKDGVAAAIANAQARADSFLANSNGAEGAAATQAKPAP